jgi:hypothetical protein
MIHGASAVSAMETTESPEPRRQPSWLRQHIRDCPLGDIEHGACRQVLAGMMNH